MMNPQQCSDYRAALYDSLEFDDIILYVQT